MTAPTTTATHSPRDDDLDGDGYDLVDDCEDDNGDVNPGQTEVPGNGQDDGCDAGTLDNPGAGPDGGTSDGGMRDGGFSPAASDGGSSGADAGAKLDAGLPDAGPPDDAGSPIGVGADAGSASIDGGTDSGTQGLGEGGDNNPQKEEAVVESGCGCKNSHHGASSMWLLLSFLAFHTRRNSRRAGLRHQEK